MRSLSLQNKPVEMGFKTYKNHQLLVCWLCVDIDIIKKTLFSSSTYIKIKLQYHAPSKDVW